MRTTLALLLAVVAGMLLPSPDSCAQSPTNAPSDSGLVMYYFHRTGRCQGCLEIERLTRKTADEFKEEYPLDLFTLEVKNLDEPENERFADDFKVTFNTVVIASRKDGVVAGWTNLNDRVWNLYSDEGSFVDCIKEELRKRQPDQPE